jgi:hypothetical protein
MAAQMELVNCKMQIKTQAGTLDSGKPRVKSYTLAGVDENAGAQLLLDVSGAVGSVIANPVLETYRVDSRLVSDDGE